MPSARLFMQFARLFIKPGRRGALLPLMTFSVLMTMGACRATDSTGDALKVQTVADELGVVWGIAFVSPRQLLVTQRDGTISLLNLDERYQMQSLQTVTGGPEVSARGQGGLLDVAVSADYSAGGWIYFTYSKPHLGNAVTTLARARLTGSELTDWSDLLITESHSKTSRHFGSRIAFDNNGHLFFGVGDRGHRPNGQDLSTHAGTIIRLNLDGSVPADNPFVGHSTALPHIWSYGHRNPQGLCYDQRRQALWEGEHGPRGGDEVNRILPGRNYGWAEVSHGKEYSGLARVGEATERADVEPAVQVYIPSIAPGSLLCYDGDLFPEWRGDLFQGALKLTHLNHLKLTDNGRVKQEERYLQSRNERIRALQQAPDGAIFAGTDSGKILRLLPARD